MVDSLVHPYLLPFPSHCMPWCCTVTAVFHSSWRSWAQQLLRSFLSGIHVTTGDVLQVEQYHAGFYFQSVTKWFLLSPARANLFLGVSLSPPLTLSLGWGEQWRWLSSPIEGEHEQVLYLVLCASRTAQVQAQLSRVQFEREQEKERDLLSHSITAWQVTGGPREKAAFHT